MSDVVDDPFNKKYDNDLHTWVCGHCNRPLRSDGECTTRQCVADAEFKRLGIDK
jgi:hypothetical protein